MELVENIVVLLHLIGFASIFGGILVQVAEPEPEINMAMLHGSYFQLLTGIVLVVFAEFGSEPVNHIKIAIKLVVALIIAILVIINRRFSSIPRGLLLMLGALTLANAAVAVLWQ